MNTAIYSPSGAYAGIGFAVPVDEVNRVVPQLIRHGKLIKPGLGATLADERLARRLGVTGVLVLNIEKNGPAHQAGIKPTSQFRGEVSLGDIITDISGVEVNNYDELRRELEKFRIGEQVMVGVIREGERREIPVTLSAIN